MNFGSNGLIYMNRPVYFENGMLAKLTVVSPDSMKLFMQISFVLARFQSLWRHFFGVFCLLQTKTLDVDLALFSF